MCDLELLFLGSGTSHGVPMIGCQCGACTSSDPRDKRFRASVAVTLGGGEVILIDISPEFRLAAIAHQLPRVDALLLTHGHADHIMGLDDIRRYNNIGGGTIPCYGDAGTLEVVRRCFPYAVGPYNHPDRPSISLHEIAAPTEICGAAVQPVPLVHGRLPILGFRIGGMAYCTDCSAIEPAGRAMLAGLDLLVIDALRYTPHPTHMNVEETLAMIETLSPRRALLTHIAHEIRHAELEAKLPPHVRIAYDGLRVRAPI
jgi:phosphoribosyl 1,2-cyclic phosphate phosphodiesterase